MRHKNSGLRKICGCARRTWAKCEHSWHFNFKLKGGAAYRFSVDSEAAKHIEAKGDAEALADGWRTAIRHGKFRRQIEQVTTLGLPSDIVTLENFGATYAERLGRPVSANHKVCFKQFCAFTAPDTTTTYGARALAVFTEDDLEAFFAAIRAKGFAESTINKYVQMVTALFRWATKKGYLTRNPAADSDVLKRRKHAQRQRRLESGEEALLLAQAGPHLQRLIVAALETGMRRGELLGLTWANVNMDRKEITVRAETTKTRTARVLPMSSRLSGVLEMAQTALGTMLDSGPAKGLSDSERAALVASGYVFGDVAGRQVKDIKRAWETCLLKAHGHKPTWNGGNDLDEASRAALRAVDLTFHDLRHEAGSRLLEAGWQLHNVAHMLGHANISQTSTYLNATRVGLQDAMRRLDASRCKPVASKTEIDRAPHSNEDESTGAQVVVN